MSVYGTCPPPPPPRPGSAVSVSRLLGDMRKCSWTKLDMCNCGTYVTLCFLTSSTAFCFQRAFFFGGEGGGGEMILFCGSRERQTLRHKEECETC